MKLVHDGGLKMTIFICGDRTITVPHEVSVNSEYVKDVVNLYHNHDTEIIIPVKYHDVIDMYVGYLNYNNNNNNSDININIDSQHLLLCFELSTFLIDEGYFKYCVQQVFNDWSCMCNMVYNEFNDDLKWCFFIHAPYNFIPKYLLNNNTFINQWHKNNVNTIIKVNGNNECYYNNIQTVNSNGNTTIRIYHTVNDVERGYKRVIEYYPGYNNNYSRCNDIKNQNHYINGERYGTRTEWYEDKQLKLALSNGINKDKRCVTDNKHTKKPYFECYYVNGAKHGPFREWYDDGDNNGENNYDDNLSCDGYYINNKRYGLWRYWYDNNDGDEHLNVVTNTTTNKTQKYQPLECQGYYVNDVKHGLWRSWYNNDKHTVMYERSYINGKEHGKWKQWYNEIPVEEISTSGIQIMGSQTNICCSSSCIVKEGEVKEGEVKEEVKENNIHEQNLIYYSCMNETNYVDGKAHGKWKQWYNNPWNSLEYEGQFVDNEQHGLWQYWYDDKLHTLKRIEHWTVGKHNDRWIEFDINCNITSGHEYSPDDEQ